MGYVYMAALAPALIWYGLCGIPWIIAFRRGEPAPLLSVWGVQLALAPALVALMIAGPIGLLLALLVPGVLPALAAHEILAGSMAEIALQNWIAILSGGAFGLVLPAIGLRYWQNRDLPNLPLIANLSGACVTLAVAEVRSVRRMTERTEALGAACHSRQGFLPSIWQSWGEFGRHPHAEALIDGQWHHWSYRADDFVITPRKGSLDPWQRDCQERIAWEREGGRP